MTEPEHIEKLLSDIPYLKKHTTDHLYASIGNHQFIDFLTQTDIRPSAVLFLLSHQTDNGETLPEPSLVLNKRSAAVRQAGDLCCPGGGVSLPRDANLARMLGLPGSPLKRWSSWKKYRANAPDVFEGLKILLATSLRESYEEMRLNPLRVTFLGMLPAQRLGEFSRAIYPMVGWLPHQRKFQLNGEVDKIVTIPIRNLLNPENYALTHFSVDAASGMANHPNWDDYPCFVHKQGNISEVLWGATFRITMLFLEIVFGFSPPPQKSLTRVSRVLNSNYFTGNPR